MVHGWKSPPLNTDLVGQEGISNRFKLIRFSRANQIPIKFDISGRLQPGASSACLYLVPAVHVCW